MKRLILVADGDPFNLRLLQEVCENANYKVATAADGTQLLDVVARERPDLILMDLELSCVDGFGVLKVLKGDPELASIPVLVVAAADNTDGRSKALELGADDYVGRPYRVFEIQQRLRNALRLHEAEENARAQSGAPHVTDPLTRAGTAEQLMITLDYEFTRAERYGHHLAYALVQISNVDAITEAGGQETMDGVLVQLAAGLRGCIRGIDHLFRSDAASFTVLLPETAEGGADKVLERIRERAGDQTLFAASMSPEPEVKAAVAVYPEDRVPNAAALQEIALTRLKR